jgi:multidrug resistance efflux pump
MRKFITSLALVAMLAELAPAADHDVPVCYVLVKREVEVPAQEAGLLDTFDVEKGDGVTADAMIAKIDDRQAVMKKNVAQAEFKAAEEQAKNNVNVRFSKAAAEVAKAELQKAAEARRELTNAVSAAEFRRLQLSLQKSELGIEQADMEWKVAGLTAEVKKTEMQAADVDIKRREIRTPITGQVMEVFKEKGEWVQAGEPVALIVQMDVLKVEGYVNIKEVSPAQVKGKPVTVRAKLTGGEEVEFQGKVTFVSPEVEIGGSYRISADIINRQDPSGEWLLRPGLETSMTIHVDRAATAEKPVKRK